VTGAPINPHRASVSDEQLMAFADGELRGPERDSIQAYVAANPDAARRVAEFAASRDALTRLLNQALTDPVPARLLETVMGDAGHPGGSDRKPVTSPGSIWQTLTAPLAGLFGSWPLTASTALAASALAGVVIGSQLIGSQGMPKPDAGLVAWEDGRVVAARTLASALDTTQSGTTAVIAAGANKANLTPLLTFKTKAGEYCRQFTLQHVGDSRSAALACRTPSGRWTMEATGPMGVSGARDKVAVAGADEVPAVDAAVTRLISGDALGSSDEQNLIAQHWSAPAQP